ncbi:Lipopolysaccharide-assembly [Mariniphaga anaerophila]|uniref:Lipopolysaccharide-assembly n=1 Tax=Mariniphaga anaerophila TaxID=1484053 RepID=A0A1M4YFU1_9BACT|nr:LptE family protein [Mariniphaga anaerophila]SHF04591.1 Lipopolysaccharide-assembly [Mariniphaga anaerophila]
MQKRLVSFFTIILLAAVVNSCRVSYSFTGANISPAVKTFSVYYFPNRARLINPTLSQSFTESLREKLQRQTPLNELAEDGDLIFEGQITGYDVRPMSIQKEDMAALNRLTISVRVKYTNNIDPDQNIEQTFSAYEDFDATSSLSAVEDGLVPEIITKLTEDIFNATLANW